MTWYICKDIDIKFDKKEVEKDGNKFRMEQPARQARDNHNTREWI